MEEERVAVQIGLLEQAVKQLSNEVDDIKHTLDSHSSIPIDITYMKEAIHDLAKSERARWGAITKTLVGFVVSVFTAGVVYYLEWS